MDLKGSTLKNLTNSKTTGVQLLQNWRNQVNRVLQKKAVLEGTVIDLEDEYKEARFRLKAAEKAQQIIQELAKGIQETVHKQIASVVTRCLCAVFDEPYNFQIKFERKRGKTEARLVFIRGDLEIDPLSSAGGGVIDVAAFALRVSCIMLSRPAIRKVLFLDEPFKFVSEQYRPAVAGMLEMLSNEFQMQIVMVTHIKELELGTVVSL